MITSLDAAEAAKLNLGFLQIGVARAIANRSPFIRLLASKVANGASYIFNRELARPAVGPLPVNSPYIQGKRKLTQVTQIYKRFGGEAPIDTFLAQLNGTMQSVRGDTSLSQAEALADYIENVIVNGDSTADPEQFDGLLKLIPATQTIEVDGPLTIDVINKAANLAKVRADRMFWAMPPDVEVQYRNILGPYASAAEKMNVILGEEALTARGKPIVLSDFLLKNETTSAGANTGYSALLVGTDRDRGATIVLPPDGSLAFNVKFLGQVPGHPMDTAAVEVACTMALHSELTCVRLSKIQA